MQHSGTSQEELMLFIKRLSKSLHDENMTIVLAIPPPVYQGGYTGSFVREHFNFLSSDVDFFSLMTYDYSNPYIPGPNSPIKWVRECVELLAPSGSKSNLRYKILVGLNFYGYDLVPNQRSGHPVLGHEFVRMVDKHHPKFRWNSEWAEHYIEFEDSSGHEHVVYFPSTLSIARRISLVQELGTGISIWEIGQGLDSFYEQL
uniref:Chitinase domain-containing protein 1 n=3 Tax=Schistocephalus solidus TaxID=70667 RepID=A0A0V0J5Q3_SCHSO